jgi:hypothetical protein
MPTMSREQITGSAENSRPINGKSGPTSVAITPLRAIAMILAHGVLRLQKRQKDLDSPTEQRVHDHVLVTKGETL